ncbi:hypothetical protein OEV98_11000 [Caldibacillus lycopersici]|uniref:DUF7210 domain-containing protein n=1 Tax=Perspicuibacillus lycopersici TaxID=1325689 RepID=A0AAE3ITW9_9BACI|nr:hypothetical protein [Perspicuibacillus lycopersici]MCU9614087.1 hypothetical protein [Perspicuibacillus lycopersici]
MDLKVKGHVKHNGKWYKPGQELKKIKNEDGNRLVDLDAAEEIGKSEEPKVTE